jgi:hypothetical protein
MLLSVVIASTLTLSGAVVALPQSQPFREVLRSRQSAVSNALEVDLGYEIYQGSSNTSTGINTWRGYGQFTISNDQS